MKIDCPYYKEFASYMPGGMSRYNCWGEGGWDDYPCNCNVPGETSPICDPKKNGWIKGKFVAKVDKLKLEKALKAFQYKETLKPRNIVKRLDEIEKKLKEIEIGAI